MGYLMQAVDSNGAVTLRDGLKDKEECIGAATNWSLTFSCDIKVSKRVKSSQGHNLVEVALFRNGKLVGKSKK
jgi:hypothetical protein